MEFFAKLDGVTQDYMTGDKLITFRADDLNISDVSILQDIRLKVKAEKARKHRSLDCNRYLWALIGKMAENLRTDKWTIYLKMLKQYGQFTYVVIRPKAVETFKAQWRECEELGEIEVNGQKGIQFLCYFGSSTYDQSEIGVLIDGVISECKELGIDTLTPDEIAKMVEVWKV